MALKTQRVKTKEALRFREGLPLILNHSSDQILAGPADVDHVALDGAHLDAGLRAGMDVVAFLGSEIYQNENYAAKVKKLGIKNIFYDMASLKKFLDI